MRLLQATGEHGERIVVASDSGRSWIVAGSRSVRELALAAIERATSLAELVTDRGETGAADPARLLANGRVHSPIDHPDPAHLLVTGTGLSHLGSASARAAMHQKLAGGEDALTDSMKMFRLGLDGGKPAPGETGVQPEWFYKGDGASVAAPGAPLVSPAFADDSGEEPEITGIYVVAPDGRPFRVGFALGNEFSDHVMERRNYLYLAHSKLRPMSFGPEILLGRLPPHLGGVSRIRRAGRVVWEREFLTGEGNMSHSIANLEAHHFKYAAFRRPGDVHVHFFGTATLSFSDGVKLQTGDAMEIEIGEFGLPLVNPLEQAESETVSIGVL